MCAALDVTTAAAAAMIIIILLLYTVACAKPAAAAAAAMATETIRAESVGVFFFPLYYNVYYFVYI